MGLPVPKEPTEIKALMKSVRKNLGQGDDIEHDSLAVWSFNKLPKYLWEQWKGELKKRGITWQKFLRILKLRTVDIIDWGLKESLTWEDLIERIEDTINSYSGKNEVRP